MLIDIQNRTLSERGDLTTYCYPDFDISVSGVIFTPGRKAGRETVDRLAEELQDGAVRFRTYFGAYVVVVEWKNGELILWCDNSYMRNVYRSAHFFGTDIRAVARAEGLRELDEAALCEFLTFTRTYSRRTLIRGIGVCENDRYYRVGGQLEILDKGIGTLSDPPLFTEPDDFFREMCRSLQDENTICALTGGYDSRLVAAAFRYYGKNNCFISGDNPASDDICVAREAARKAGIDLQVLVPPYERIGDMDHVLAALFARGTYAAPMSTSGCRIAWFQDELKRMGYTALITGDAGGVHKDFWFKQDFPFYWSKRSHMKRMVDSRFVVTRKDGFLGDRLQPLYRQLLEQAYARFESLRRDRNARSCLLGAWEDWASTSVKQPGADTIAMYAPLHEFELARYAYSILPRGKRMNLFHRTYITRYQPDMAKVRTVYGTNASSAPQDLVLDVFFQLKQTARSAYRYAYRQVFHRNIALLRGADKISLNDAIRDSAIAREAVAWAERNGYIRPAAQTLPADLTGKLIYCCLLERAVRAPEGD